LFTKLFIEDEALSSTMYKDFIALTDVI